MIGDVCLALDFCLILSRLLDQRPCTARRDATFSPILTFALLYHALGHEIFRRHLIPPLDIFYSDLANRNCSVPVSVNFVLHGLELAHLLSGELVAHEVEEGELADTVQDGVDELRVQARAEEEHQRSHLHLMHCTSYLCFFHDYLALQVLNVLQFDYSCDFTQGLVSIFIITTVFELLQLYNNS